MATRLNPDKYANIISTSIATNGAAYVNSEVTTGVSLGEGKGMLIDQIDYFFASALIVDFIAAAAGDNLSVLWAVQDDQIGYANSKVIHQMDTIKWDDGTAAVSFNQYMPISFKFDPPLIVASPKLFLTCYGSASISGGLVYSRMYFRYVSLSAQEYLELAESFVLTS